jgi:pimeloyl-ACP methyl ester carboxylesterase
MLLVAGLGMQMIGWDEELCEQLAAQGYWVVRYDNRDVGRSTHFDQAGVPNILALMQGGKVDVPYKLIDMAKDAVGLLDALEIEKAHIVGVSMGGMIVQTIALHFPERVLSMTSIMSTTGDPTLPQARPEVQMILVTPAPAEREAYLDYQVGVNRTLNGPEFPLDEARTRKHAAQAFERGLNPAGFGRQLAAIIASGSRKEALASLRVPTLVIHGSGDPLIPVPGGYATAEAIPGAKLEIIPGMGHALPQEVWPRVIALISEHARA